MPAQKKTRTPMSDSHKAALADGRRQGLAVRRYLEALQAHKPKRGRKRTPESIRRRLAKIDTELETADQLKRLQLTQEQINLNAELARLEAGVDLSELEEAFVEAAGPYSDRKRISYTAWRAMDVPADVLARAGITRKRN
jgi:hypothetical protein